MFYVVSLQKKHRQHHAVIPTVAMVVQKHSWVFAMNNHPIESWDLWIPSLSVACSLTKVPCGQWVHDFGSSGRMQMSYFGQNHAGVQRFHIRMVSDGRSWVVARMDSDGNWITNDEQPLKVTLTPTICNLLKRVAALEELSLIHI